MSYLYKRRRPSLVKNFWVYRRLIALAMVLGLMLWFIWANNTPVTVAFPFRLGTISSSLGLVILASALVGGLLSALTLTLVYTFKRKKSITSHAEEEVSSFPDDRPPTDYAAKTTEGFSESNWS